MKNEEEILLNIEKTRKFILGNLEQRENFLRLHPEVSRHFKHFCDQGKQLDKKTLHDLGMMERAIVS